MVVITNSAGIEPSPLNNSTSASMTILLVVSLRDDVERKRPLIGPFTVVNAPVSTATDYRGFSTRHPVSSA